MPHLVLRHIGKQLGRADLGAFDTALFPRRLLPSRVLQAAALANDARRLRAVEGCNSVLDGISKMAAPSQGSLLTVLGEQLLTAQGIPAAREKAHEDFRAAAEKVVTNRTASFEAIIIEVKAHLMTTSDEFLALMDDVNALPEALRGKSLAALGARISLLMRGADVAAEAFNSRAQEIKQPWPPLLADLVHAAANGWRGLLARELRLAGKGGPLLESVGKNQRTPLHICREHGISFFIAKMEERAAELAAADLRKGRDLSETLVDYGVNLPRLIQELEKIQPP